MRFKPFDILKDILLGFRMSWDEKNSYKLLETEELQLSINLAYHKVLIVHTIGLRPFEVLKDIQTGGLKNLGWEKVL